MHRLNELAAKLTPAQLKEVEDFAEFLAERGERSKSQLCTSADHIDVDRLAGLCQGMGGDKTSVELVHEALDAMARKYDRGV